MFLKYIKMYSFRNYRQQEIKFNPAVNMVVGENAQGKTNLLEAIYYLLTCCSFRTEIDREMVSWKTNSFFLQGAVKENSNINTVEIGYQIPNKLQIVFNGKANLKKNYKFLFPVVFFGPEDLRLVKDGPAIRRRYLDMVGVRLGSRYYHNLKDYHRVLQQRNRVIRERRFKGSLTKYLEIWNEPLARLGSYLIKQRIWLVEQLERWSKEFFINVFSDEQEMSLQYVCSVDYSDSPDEFSDQFYRQLCLKQSEEEIRGYTLLGPHADDFKLSINGQPARIYSSQGQQRIAVLALKMGEVQLLELKYRQKPVLLLDDVFSELDLRRRGQLLQFTKQKGMQMVITTVLPPGQLTPLKADTILTIKGGEVVETAS